MFVILLSTDDRIYTIFNTDICQYEIVHKLLSIFFRHYIVQFIHNTLICYHQEPTYWTNTNQYGTVYIPLYTGKKHGKRKERSIYTSDYTQMWRHRTAGLRQRSRAHLWNAGSHASWGVLAPRSQGTSRRTWRTKKGGSGFQEVRNTKGTQAKQPPVPTIHIEIHRSEW